MVGRFESYYDRSNTILVLNLFNTCIPLLYFNDTDIKFVESHKYLVVTFTHNSQLHPHRHNIVQSAYKTVGITR